MQFTQIILAMNTAGFFGVIIVGVKITRHIGRMEERFDLVWQHFKRTMLSRREDDEERNFDENE